jgi:hypothetical protein
MVEAAKDYDGDFAQVAYAKEVRRLGQDQRPRPQPTPQ